MKKKLFSFLGAVVVFGAATIVWLEHQSLVQIREESQALRQQIDKVQPSVENNRVTEAAAPTDQSQAMSSEQTHELLRLRNEVTQLRRQTNELQKLRAEYQKVRSENQQLRVREQKTEAETEPRPSITIARNQACISCLRTIQAVKRQWALEHKRPDTDLPTEADLFGPTGYMEKCPVCPAGGTYTLGPVGENPTCTIPNHAL